MCPFQPVFQDISQQLNSETAVQSAFQRIGIPKPHRKRGTICNHRFRETGAVAVPFCRETGSRTGPWASVPAAAGNGMGKGPAPGAGKESHDPSGTVGGIRSLCGAAPATNPGAAPGDPPGNRPGGTVPPAAAGGGAVPHAHPDEPTGGAHRQVL